MPFEPSKKGQIIAHFGQSALILNSDQQKISAKLRPSLGQVIVGDLVEYQQIFPDYVVCKLDKRTTLLKRANKLVASNLTQMLIVIAPEPAPQFELIDSYLIAAQITGVKPLLILNKIDLLNAQNKTQIMDLLNLYQNLNLTTLQISSLKQQNFAQLQQHLAAQTSVFLGQSGVGKTSIINVLLPSETNKVQELSSINQGKHTTSVSQLFCLPNGGKLIDSPGVRSFALENLTLKQLNASFVEISKHMEKCKFRNCSHQADAGCAVQKALACGLIHPQRWRSYCRLVLTIAKE